MTEELRNLEEDRIWIVEANHETTLLDRIALHAIYRAVVAEHKIISLITTIESLQSAKEIALNSHRFLEGVIAEREATIESQKEEIQKLLERNTDLTFSRDTWRHDAILGQQRELLAVKGLKQALRSIVDNDKMVAINTINQALDEIERLSHE